MNDRLIILVFFIFGLIVGLNIGMADFSKFQHKEINDDDMRFLWAITDKGQEDRGERIQTYKEYRDEILKEVE